MLNKNYLPKIEILRRLPPPVPPARGFHAICQQIREQCRSIRRAGASDLVAWVRRFTAASEPGEAIKVDCPFEFELEHQTTIDELLFDFYRNNRKVLRPITFILNPDTRDGEPMFDGDTWVAIYYRKFYVVIQKNIRDGRGPHVAKLFYETPARSSVWLGTAQVCTVFLNRRRVKRRLKQIVKGRRFFTPEHQLSTVVSLSTDSEH